MCHMFLVPKPRQITIYWIHESQINGHLIFSKHHQWIQYMIAADNDHEQYFECNLLLNIIVFLRKIWPFISRKYLLFRNHKKYLKRPQKEEAILVPISSVCGFSEQYQGARS